MIDDALVGDRGQILPSRTLATRLRVWLILQLIPDGHVWAALQEAYLWPHCVDCGARLPEGGEHQRWIEPGVAEVVCAQCIGGGRGLFRLLRGGRG